MVTSHDPDLLTIADAARLLRVSPVTVQRWLRRGLLPAYHVGPKGVRIRRMDLAQVIIPLAREEVIAMPERESMHIPTLAPLSDAMVAQQRAALTASAELLAQMAARRGGDLFDESWPLIRAAREERSRRQA